MTAPIKKSARKTAVSGTSREGVGIPPKSAPSGAYGPADFLPAPIMIAGVERLVDEAGIESIIVADNGNADTPTGPSSNLPGTSPGSTPGDSCGIVTIDGVEVEVTVIKTVVTAGNMSEAGGIGLERIEFCALGMIEAEWIVKETRVAAVEDAVVILVATGVEECDPMPDSFNRRPLHNLDKRSNFYSERRQRYQKQYDEADNTILRRQYSLIEAKHLTLFYEYCCFRSSHRKARC